MTAKTDFTPQEWEQIINAPQMAALYIALASPSGPVGVVQEMLAATKPIVEAIKTASGNTLVDAVAADYKEKAEKREMSKPPQMGNDPAQIKAQCLDTLRSLNALLAQKAPAEGQGYKQWVLEAAKRTAQAAREGGFLGIGGESVSQAEAAALNEIAGVLSVPA